MLTRLSQCFLTAGLILSAAAQAESPLTMHITSIAAISESSAGHVYITTETSQIRVVDGSGRAVPVNGGRVNVQLIAGKDANCGNFAMAAKTLESSNSGRQSFRISFQELQNRPGSLRLTGVTTCGIVAPTDIVGVTP